MEPRMQIGSSRLFMAIAAVLVATLLLGLVAIGGLVFLRYFAGPVEVAMPPTAEVPTETPLKLETATPTSLPSATPESQAPTPTLVIAPATTTPTVAGSGTLPGQDGSGTSSPNPQTPEMPQSGLGPLEAVGAGLALVFVLGVVRLFRHARPHGRV